MAPASVGGGPTARNGQGREGLREDNDVNVLEQGVQPDCKDS